MSDSRAVYNPLADADQSLTKPLRFLKLYSPSELCAFEEPEGHKLVGDYHIQRGAISVLAGSPGVGKSRATTWLAMLGARGTGNWFGLPVHGQFRTLILQNENGLVRLHRDFKELAISPDLDAWIRISTPPLFGMAMDNPEFREELRTVIREFQPDLIIVDPWNSVTRDAMEKDFQQAFVWLREVLGEFQEKIACLIVHHLRKPKADDRLRGRGLAHLLAGSYVINSVPRATMIVQPASDDIEDNRVVFSTVKNNDGDFGKRSAWERRDNLFLEVENFDWEQFEAGAGGKRREPKVTEEHIRSVFGGGSSWLPQKDASKKLEGIAGVGRSTAYEALKVTGRFGGILHKREDGLVGLRKE